MNGDTPLGSKPSRLRRADLLSFPAQEGAIMIVHLANARELANIAEEIGAVVIDGALRYPSETGSR